MTMYRTVVCAKCKLEFREEAPAGQNGDGFPEWITINGLTDKDGHRDQFWICQEHAMIIAKYLSGEE